MWVDIFMCASLGAGAGHGAVADGSSGIGPPTAGLPEDYLWQAAPRCSETAAQGSALLH